MRRTAVAAAWVFGTTVPLIGAAAVLFGCCVLPFHHHHLHGSATLCHELGEFLAGEHHDGAHHDEQRPAPVRERQEPAKTIASIATPTIRVAAVATRARMLRPDDRIGFRSFISLGAMRCDQDVGLHVLVRTFLI